MDIQEEIRKGKSIHDLALRVTYYARVSTEHEEQSTSIVNQLDYFSRYIQNHAHWFFVPGYVDEGISGKAVEKRESFLKIPCILTQRLCSRLCPCPTRLSK